MELPTYFADFLSEIRPTDSQAEDYKNGHRILRERIESDEGMASVVVSTFLQGSYRRATAIRPTGDQRADVDVIVVTSLNSQEFSPEQAIQKFVPFVDKHYKGKYHVQGRSIAIELSCVDLDLVVTAAPSESEKAILKSAAVVAFESPEDVTDWRLVKSWLSLAERPRINWLVVSEAVKREQEWKTEPLLIPDREAATWEKTHPIAQIQWTFAKNGRCNGHYVNAVKALKWWHRYKHPDVKYPKGYPLEHIIGYCCPDSIGSVAEGVTRTLENIVSTFGENAAKKETPFLPNHGIPEQNVLHRLSGEDFHNFHKNAKNAATIARRALDSDSKKESADAWRELFGDKFPPADDGGEPGGPKGGFTPRREVSTIAGGRFAH
jgi:hypothetical protein